MAPISYRKKLELQSTLLSALAWLVTGLFPRALGRFASSQTCRLLSALRPFACVLSSAHHACPLLVNLANFSFSFMSKFKYYVLCDTLSYSLLWDEVVFSPAPTLSTGTKARSGGYSGTESQAALWKEPTF